MNQEFLLIIQNEDIVWSSLILRTHLRFFAIVKETVRNFGIFGHLLTFPEVGQSKALQFSLELLLIQSRGDIG